MPRTTNQSKQKQSKSMEASLWESANKLRGAVEPAEYKHVVLSLIFLKYAGDRFEQRKQELIAQGLKEYVDTVEFYTAENVFYLPERCRWSFIMENAKQPNIFQIIDDALVDIEKKNKQLEGALPYNYYSNLGLDKTKFASLLDEINKLDTVADAENDLIGRVYEYFLGKFAIAEGKGKGEYYTPKSIVNLIAEPLLWLGRYVRAVDEVRQGPSRQYEERERLWPGEYQHHLQAGAYEPRHPGHLG